jgi:hypothetical protein
VFLIGPRRYGKTSILKAVEDKLQVANSVVLRLDAESCPTLEMLVNGIVAGAATSWTRCGACDTLPPNCAQTMRLCLLWLVWHNMESATYVLSAKGRRTNRSSSAINLAYNVQRSPLSPFQLKIPRRAISCRAVIVCGFRYDGGLLAD